MLDAPTSEAIKYYVEMSLKGSTLGKPFVKEGGDPDSNYVAEAHVETSEPFGQQVYGQPIAFEFVLHVGEPVAKLCFMFCISDLQGGHITQFWHVEEDQIYQAKKGDYRLRCVVPKLRLYMGSYCVTAWITDTRGQVPLDKVSQICQFEVNMGEYRRKGLAWHEDHSQYLEEAEWHPVAEA